MKNNMNIRLLAFDLDGTALVLHKNLSDINRAALKKAQEKGVLLVPATGRIKTFLPGDIMDLGEINYTITSNGASVNNMLSGETIHSALIPNVLAREVQKILNAYHIYIEYYRDGGAITLSGNPDRAMNDREFPASKHHFLTKKYTFVESFEDLVNNTGICPEKINLPYLPFDTRNELIEKLGKLKGLKLTSSIPDNLEINSYNATKGIALEKLCKYLGIARDECMSIGDNGNDADMLEFAGVSVAMGNSSQEAFDSAKYRTLSCENDGLAEAIYKFILG